MWPQSTSHTAVLVFHPHLIYNPNKLFAVGHGRVSSGYRTMSSSFGCGIGTMKTFSEGGTHTLSFFIFSFPRYLIKPDRKCWHLKASFVELSECPNYCHNSSFLCVRSSVQEIVWSFTSFEELLEDCGIYIHLMNKSQITTVK